MLTSTNPPKEKVEKKTDVAVEFMLNAELLKYNMPKNNSIVTEKTQTDFYPTKSTFSGKSDDSIVWTLNSGSYFFKPEESDLYFTLKLAGNRGTHAVDFGSGSSLNIFSEYTAYSKAGDEMEKIRRLAPLRSTIDQNTKSRDWFENEGSYQGYRPQLNVAGTAVSIASSKYEDITAFTDRLYAGGVTFKIPMSQFGGIWDPYNKSILPSHLMSGMRIELRLENNLNIPFRLYGGATTTITDYTVSNVHIKSTVLKLTDSIMRQLSLNASNGAMHIPIHTYDRSGDDFKQTNVNLEIRKNAGNVNSAIALVRLTTDTTAIDKDSVGSETDVKVTSYRWRHGSTFIPNGSVKDKSIMGALSSNAWKKFRKTSGDSNVSLNEYRVGKKFSLCTDLDRSGNVDMAGVGINNAKVLSLELEFEDAPASRTVDVWIEYTRVLSVYLTNVLIQD